MKTISVAFLTALSVSLLIGFFWTETTLQKNTPYQDTVFASVTASNTLRCGYALFPGVMERDLNTGQMSGLIHDIVMEAGKLLKLEIVWAVETTWGQFPQDLAAGKFDAWCGAIWMDSELGRVIEAPEPVFFEKIIPVVRADDARFDSRMDKINAPQTVIAIIDGDTSEKIKQMQFPDAAAHNMPAFTGQVETLLAVAHNKADITFTTVTGLNLFNANNTRKLKIVEAVPPLRMMPTHLFGIKKGEISLLNMLSHSIREIHLSGFAHQRVKSDPILQDNFVFPEYF